MSSKNRKFRKKVEDLAGSNEEQPSSLNVPIKGLAAQEKGKEKKPKKISLLSFDEEEGTSPETAKIVPRENSKVTVRPKHRGRSRKDEQNKNEDFKPASTQQSGVGECLHTQIREQASELHIHLQSNRHEQMTISLCA